MMTENREQKTESRKQMAENKQRKMYLILICVLCSIFYFLIAYVIDAEEKQPLKFSKDVQIQHIKPKKPVKIKLHRNAKGDYSWDLTGDNVDEVVQADKRLRKLLKVE